MRKRRLFFILVLSSAITAGAQEAGFEDYQQSIPGSPLTIDMVAIEGGTYAMGSPDTEEGRTEDEGPQHQVEVASFWMASQEVTWNLYRLFMERAIDDAQPDWANNPEVALDVDGVSGATTPYVEMSFGMGTDGFPAIGMTQHAAATFCKWLSAMTGYFYRLPTEAEWEYACRAGTESAYSFGEDAALDAHAWYLDNSADGYAQIGQKTPNPWGLYDMHGNVMEWTLDQYFDDTYTTRGETTSNPYEEPFKTYPRVVRGGSWKDEASELRCANREFSKKKWKQRDPQIPKSIWWHTDAPFVGFRVIRPAEVPPEEDRAKYWDE